MRGKRFVVILNPHGGKRRGPAVLEAVKPVFAASGAELDVHFTERAGHTSELASTLPLDDCDAVCVIGGDGTIHEAVRGLIQREKPAAVPLGVIPGGTGNSMHEHLGCVDPLDAARRIVSGNAVPLDVARVQTSQGVDYCVNIIGWGAMVDVNRTAERLRALGPSRYAVAAIAHILRGGRQRAQLVLDGHVVEDDLVLVAACNTKFTGKAMQLAPRAEIGDGLLDVVIVRRASRYQLLRLFRSMSDGSHLSLPFVEYHQVRHFKIRMPVGDLLNLDGELKGETPMTAEVMPAALRILA